MLVNQQHVDTGMSQHARGSATGGAGADDQHLDILRDSFGAGLGHFSSAVGSDILSRLSERSGKRIARNNVQRGPSCEKEPALPGLLTLIKPLQEVACDFLK
jgi:hypothetical protein